VFKTATLAEQVYEYLLRRISTGAYPPRAPLRELDLVAQLGVSRTPIREALLRLTEYGLVEVTGRSARIRSLSPEDLVHIFQVRKALEGEAVRLACGRLTPDDFARLEALTPRPCDGTTPEFAAACFELDHELHRVIAVRSGNPILAQEIRKLHDLVQLVHQPVADRHGLLSRELREHLQIVAMLQAGDRRSSRKALLDHLRLACQSQVRCLREGIGPPPLDGRAATARPAKNPMKR
jgi:DNA-binding GntR family transcriptional regulator